MFCKIEIRHFLGRTYLTYDRRTKEYGFSFGRFSVWKSINDAEKAIEEAMVAEPSLTRDHFTIKGEYQ